MKTLIIFNDMENPLEFLVTEGDFSRFNGVVVNATKGNGFEKEFYDWMFNKETGERNHPDQWTKCTCIIEGKQWDKVAICTWIP